MWECARVFILVIRTLALSCMYARAFRSLMRPNTIFRCVFWTVIGQSETNVWPPVGSGAIHRRKKYQPFVLRPKLSISMHGWRLHYTLRVSTRKSKLTVESKVHSMASIESQAFSGGVRGRNLVKAGLNLVNTNIFFVCRLGFSSTFDSNLH